MTPRKLAAIALIGAGVATVGPAMAADRDDGAGTATQTPATGDGGSTAAGTGGGQGNGQTATKPLRMQGVIDRVENAGYRDVREVERKGGGRWEVDATDRQGRRVDLYVDGRTGKIRRDDGDRD